MCYFFQQTTATLLDLNSNAGGSPVTLHENTNAQQALALVSCTPDNSAGAHSVTALCTCNLDTSTIPANGPFDVWKLSGETCK